MEIYINNKLAALKQGTSFEYISENRLFSGSDGYTLTITFPLKDCQQNRAIFGHINRDDVSLKKIIFDCEIRDKGLHKFGCITITEINETDVKTQFLDGRSERNFNDTLDSFYINELDLGAPTDAQLAPANTKPSDVWNVGHYPTAVPLPWVNNNAESGNIQNCISFANNVYSWHSDIKGLSWQPYLLYITRKICEAIGYTYDFSEWEEDETFRYIVVCNTLPFSWYIPEYARALPHWTVEEYFTKLELFMGGEFEFDHRAKSITFKFSKTILSAIAPVSLDNIVEGHSIEVKVDNDKCEYVEAVNLVYKDCDHQMWKFYSCDWFIKAYGNTSSVVRYDTLAELLDENAWLASWNGSSQRGSNRNNVLYAADVDTYFVTYAVSRTQTGTNSLSGRPIYNYKVLLQPINIYGGRIVDDSNDAQQNEIEFVPVRIDYTDDTFGRCMFLNIDGYDEESTSGGTRPGGYDSTAEVPFYNSRPVYTLQSGEKEKKSEYFDRIFIGWWDGAFDSDMYGKLPYPRVDDVCVAEDWRSYYLPHFSLRLNDSRLKRHVYNIDPTQKRTFKFLADKIPNVRALFIVKGKRYICEKITATFTENGMSQLLKGVFYPIVE